MKLGFRGVPGASNVYTFGFKVFWKDDAMIGVGSIGAKHGESPHEGKDTKGDYVRRGSFWPCSEEATCSWLEDMMMDECKFREKVRWQKE